jgi:hypothetical protein
MDSLDKFTCWILLDEDIPDRVGETTGAKKITHITLFNPNHFPMVDLLPGSSSFTASDSVVPVVFHWPIEMINRQGTSRKGNYDCVLITQNRTQR